MTSNGFFSENWTDGLVHAPEGKDPGPVPAGGVSSGRGFTVSWQNGPLGRGTERREPNGAFVEDVLAACKNRIEWYQTACGGQFACEENESAILAIELALARLDERTKRRETAGTEGTHAGS